jgi:hypothetical protein
MRFHNEVPDHILQTLHACDNLRAIVLFGVHVRVLSGAERRKKLRHLFGMPPPHVEIKKEEKTQKWAQLSKFMPKFF